MGDARLVLRNRILGLLIRSKREAAHRTRKECAAALGISVRRLAAYESGERLISLPELEALAYLLHPPVSAFWENNAEPEAPDEETLPLPTVVALRQRIVGALLRQARTDAGLSLQDVARWLGTSANRIAAYEYGERPIPFAELERVAEELRRPLEYFLGDGDGPLGTWHQQMAAWRRFQALPPEVQDFVLRPANIRYLEVAMRLAQIPAGGLRSIAEGLLEITY